MRSIALCITLFISAALTAQIPSFGTSNQLDVACWNIKWFGDLNNGPSDETRQFNNALKVFRETNVDVWGLSEISSNTVFNRLLDSLESYDGVIAPYSQTQKTALIYDTSLFRLLYGKVVITNQNYDFASGRFPFEVALLPKYGDQTDTLICLVLHLKANVGNTTERQEAWRRRKNAAGHIKTHIDLIHPNKKVIVLGDFNDDTDLSIYNSNPTPFDTFLQDASNYKFLTIPLTANNTSSTTGFSNMIDHQLVSNELFGSYVSNSCKVIPLQNYISSYSFSTSDHYPVTASYTYQFVGLDQLNNSNTPLYPNPLGVREKLYIKNGTLLNIYNMQGEKVNKMGFLSSDTTRNKGVYLIQIELNGTLFNYRISVP